MNEHGCTCASSIWIHPHGRNRVSETIREYPRVGIRSPKDFDVENVGEHEGDDEIGEHNPLFMHVWLANAETSHRAGPVETYVVGFDVLQSNVAAMCDNLVIGTSAELLELVGEFDEWDVEMDAGRVRRINLINISRLS
jgi:hypothetical protein